MPKMIQKPLLVGVVILAVVLLGADRFYWAQVSQWREDQATNIWLGYTEGLNNIAVGLISSRNIPNPNGMVVLGFFLSTLPNLLSVSFFLGVVQMLLLILLGWQSFGRNWRYFLLATVPPLTSVMLRSISVEFWNQYMMALINVCFIFWALRYLENSSLWNLPPIAILILSAPSLYLAGIINAITMTLITLLILIYKRPKPDNFRFVFVVTSLLIASSILITWAPYFRNVSWEQITTLNEVETKQVGLFRSAWESLFGLPQHAIFQWADSSFLAFTFKHADPRILSPSTEFQLSLVRGAYLAQAVFAFITAAYLVLSKVGKAASPGNLGLKINTSIARIIVLSGLFIILSYTLSPWLRGAAWIKGERPDQVVQFFPMFLYIVFLLPLIISAGDRTGKIIARISYLSLIIFSAGNLLCGFMIVQDHLRFRGRALTEADVPLMYKNQVVSFIASDWQKHSSSSIIPVDYDLTGDKWFWAPEFGLKITKWYPAPMTIGRGFDYELLRRYGLTNQQEGIQLRTFGTGRYLVTYTFKPPPSVQEGIITHHIFGRLRVSVVEK